MYRLLLFVCTSLCLVASDRDFEIIECQYLSQGLFLQNISADYNLSRKSYASESAKLVKIINENLQDESLKEKLRYIDQKCDYRECNPERYYWNILWALEEKYNEGIRKKIAVIKKQCMSEAHNPEQYYGNIKRAYRERYAEMVEDQKYQAMQSMFDEDEK